MFRLYGLRPDGPRKLVATFDTEAQLLAYVNWATLKTRDDGSRLFEQGSSLVGCTRFEHSQKPLPEDRGQDDANVDHNPTPSML